MEADSGVGKSQRTFYDIPNMNRSLNGGVFTLVAPRRDNQLVAPNPRLPRPPGVLEPMKRRIGHAGEGPIHIWPQRTERNSIRRLIVQPHIHKSDSGRSDSPAAKADLRIGSKLGPIDGLITIDFDRFPVHVAWQFTIVSHWKTPGGAALPARKRLNLRSTLCAVATLPSSLW